MGTIEEMPTPKGLVRAKQTERLVAALVAPTAPSLPSYAVIVPAFALPALPVTSPAKYDHRVVLLDDQGRLREATLFTQLGWKPGDHIAIAESADRLILTADPTSSHSLDPRGRLKLPDALRKFRGWSAGVALVLSASGDGQTLVVSPTSLLDELVVLHECA